MTRIFRAVAIIAGLLLVALTMIEAQNTPPRYMLASGGKATTAIVIGTQASQRTRLAAKTLADYLSKIAGTKFDIEAGDGATGIAVGLVADFPAVTSPNDLRSKDPTRTEDYWLHSHAKGLHVIGASDSAVEHAI